MDVLITYDIQSDAYSSKNTAVKDGMRANGYSESFEENSDAKVPKTTYWLPNSSLWKNVDSPQIAINELMAVAKANNAIVERVMATHFYPWAGIPGKPYKLKRPEKS